METGNHTRPRRPSKVIKLVINNKLLTYHLPSSFFNNRNSGKSYKVESHVKKYVIKK